MNFLASIFFCVSLAFGTVLPADSTSRDITPRDPQTADPSCTHGPQSRACWSNGYSIATDFDLKSPRTGNTVSYHLEITNGTCNPDGNGDKPCFLINGQYPGPLIEATWGDRLEVTVTNSLLYNGTSLHFHGVRQLGSCGADGVAGITQCPIAPGQSFTYSFLVTQFGSSWYHSHFSNQYGDGVVGPMVFHGPASANYDEDLGTYTLTDWLYTTAAQAGWNSQHSLQTGGGPPVPNNILINGTNKNAAGGGTYNQVVMEKGKKYRLRLINISVDNYFQVSLDGHPLLVMTTDFVPIQPYTTEWLLIGIGQRYDVVIHANQTAGNYWFRANVATECLSSNDHNGRAIWSYDGVPVADPDDNPFPSPTAGCIEPTPSPYWRQSVPSGSFAAMASRVQVNISSAQVVPGGDTVVVWALNDTAISIDWARPTFSYLHDGDSNFTRGMSVVPAVQEGRWNYWLIQQSATAPPIPHPIHLHGHDFHVLGQGHGQYDESQALNWKAPPRRDTATVYAGGWLAMAFPSNNPGIWLIHCHIAWHISEGLGMQFLEEPDKIEMPLRATYDGLCDTWKDFAQGMPYPKEDSGL